MVKKLFCYAEKKLSEILRQVLGKPVKVEELSLSGLTAPVVTHERVQAVIEARKKREQECREKYGDDWREHYLRLEGIIPVDGVDIDEILEIVNHSIYVGTRPHSTSADGKYQHELITRYQARLHEIYGDAYDELIHHEYKDPRVGELLVNDAIKTGRWRELPDVLHERYHSRMRELRDAEE